MVISPVTEEEPIAAVSESIRAARVGHAMLVCAVDGGVGAGKSTLAKGVRDRLGGVSVLRADHFFLPLNEYPAARLPQEKMHIAVFRGRLNAGVIVPSGWRGVGDLDVYLSRASSGSPVIQAAIDRC
jgi:tRNA A37 threonylcarbamoyladenosine biosynthesis protein TsaE